MYVCIGRFEQLPDHGRRDLVRCNRRYVPGTSLLNIVTVMESFCLCNFSCQGSENRRRRRRPPKFFWLADTFLVPPAPPTTPWHFP